MIEPGACIYTFGIYFDGVISISGNCHCAGDLLDIIGIIHDRITAVIQNRTIADVGICSSVRAMNSMCRVVLDHTTGDRGRRIVNDTKSGSSAFLDHTIADRNIAIGIIEPDISISRSSVTDIAIFEQTTGISAVEIDILPVSGCLRF